MRVPWTRQPPGFTRLDTNHPLSKGIVSGIDARGWSLVGKATSRAGTINSTGPRPGGVALIGNNAGLISEQFPSGTPIDYPFTVVAYMSRITRTANNNFAAGLGNNGGNQVAVFQLSTSGGASNRFLYRNVNGGASPATNYNVNASTSSDVPVVLSATIKGVTNADIDLYWNGVNDTGTGLNSPTSGTPAFDRFAIGGVDRSADGFADTGNDVLFAFVTSKGWSAADHLAFAKNPWQIFEPIVVPVKTASSGVSIDCIVGNATAAGIQATIQSPISISCSVGNATAAGVSATIVIAESINCTPGNAVAAGVQASIDEVAGNTTIDCTPGNAVAAGVACSIVSFSSQQNSGGWLPSPPTREERDEYIRKQREALGIIPKRIAPVAKVVKRIAREAAKRGVEPTVEQVQEIAPFRPVDTQPIADALSISYRIYLALLDKDRQEREKTRQFIEQQIEQAKANALEAARLQEEEEVFVVMSLLLAD